MSLNNNILSIAIREGNDTQVEYLIKNNEININLPDQFGCIPLYWAYIYNRVDYCKLLLENGAKVKLLFKQISYIDANSSLLLPYLWNSMLNECKNENENENDNENENENENSDRLEYNVYVYCKSGPGMYTILGNRLLYWYYNNICKDRNLYCYESDYDSNDSNDSNDTDGYDSWNSSD